MIRGTPVSPDVTRRSLIAFAVSALASLCALSACRAREPTPADAAPPRTDAPRAPPGQTPAVTPGYHICFGAAGSAVELPFAQPCTSVGANDTPPSTDSRSARTCRSRSWRHA